MRIACPSCQNALSVKEEYEGRTVRCPGCRASVEVPMSLPDEPPPARAMPARAAPAAPAAPGNPFDFDAQPKTARRRADEDDEDDYRPRYRRPGAEEPPKWLMGLAAVPLVLVIVGGLIGGLCGGAAAAINVGVARQRDLAVPIQIVIFIFTTVLAVVCYIAGAAAFLKAVNGQ